ncbi:E1 DerP2 DerF2 domain containing protein, partial [Asbolus verrucosus]
FGTKPKIKVSGSLFSQVDLVSPVKASVSIKRLILGIWIPMPCKNKLGSCTYNNLCDYGYPTNVTCPEVFLKNNVPCRCPIPMGNYTITPTVAFQLPKNTSILAGTYKGTITITDNKLLLSCYNVYFVLYDADYNSVYSVIQV